MIDFSDAEALIESLGKPWEIVSKGRNFRVLIIFNLDSWRVVDITIMGPMRLSISAYNPIEDCIVTRCLGGHLNPGKAVMFTDLIEGLRRYIKLSQNFS